ncbi:MAG: glycosyltransferase family 2 protein [Promethearchaeota archaeon]
MIIISAKQNKHQEFQDFLAKYKKHNSHKLLSIILPVYNEENTVRKVLETIPTDESIEILVIDDHSTDNSLQEIKKAKVSNKLKILRHDKNMGYGAAILTGIKEARGDVLLMMDSDGQHRPEDIYCLIKPILEKNADLTIGSRYLGKCHYPLPIKTRLGEALVEKLIYIFFKTKIMNNQNGFRALNSNLKHLFKNIKYWDFAFCTEIIIKAALEGYKIKECPINLYERAHGESKIHLTKLTLNLFSCILRYFIRKIQLMTSNCNHMKKKR